MLKELLQWIDEEQLFACLLDLWPQASASSAAASLLDTLARPYAIGDSIVLKKLVPREFYQHAMHSGWMGMHAMSFVLRHRVTHLQLMFHGQLTDSNPALQEGLAESWQLFTRAEIETRPLFGCSPFGIHVATKRSGLCRAFDALNFLTCDQPATPIFCAQHATEAFWNGSPGSQQAIMYQYYAELENFKVYNEQDLQNMVHEFWQQNVRSTEDELTESLHSFGLKNISDLRNLGTEALRSKFLQLARRHHPDQGGQESSFVVLQNHYQRLKRSLLS